MRALFICDSYIEYQEIKFRSLTRRVHDIGKAIAMDTRRVALDTGVVVNGQIFEGNKFTEALESLGLRGKSVSVLLDMNTLAIREFKIPSKGKGGIAHSIYAHMRDVLDEGMSSYLFSYLENKKEKSGSTYTVTVMQKSKYESCINLLSVAGIKVSHFEIANLSVVSTLSQVYIEEKKKLVKVPGLWNEGFILLYQRDNILNMFIFKEGKNTYLTRTKLFQAKDGSYTEELVNSLTNMMKIHKDMEKYTLYLLGEDGEDTVNAINSLGLKVEAISERGELSSNYLYSILSGLSKTKYKFDFRESFEDAQEKIFTKSRVIVGSFILAALCGAAISTLLLHNNRLGVENNIERLKEEKESLETDETVLAYRELLSSYSTLSSSEENLTEYLSKYNLSGEKNELQPFQISKIKEVEDAFAGRVYITSLNYLQDGLYVDLQGEAVGSHVPAEYAEALRLSGVFANVHLTRKGYTNNAYYTFTISCTGIGSVNEREELTVSYDPFIPETEELVEESLVEALIGEPVGEILESAAEVLAESEVVNE